jgi:hypothetical protein
MYCGKITGMKSKNYFKMDWKYSVEDLIWNVEQIVGKLSISILETICHMEIKVKWSV